MTNCDIPDKAVVMIFLGEDFLAPNRWLNAEKNMTGNLIVVG